MDSETHSFKIYLESTSKTLIQLLHEFRVPVSVTLNRLYEIYVILRRRYYNFEFITEEVILAELKSLAKKAKHFQTVLPAAEQKFRQMEDNRKDIIGFIRDGIISKLHENSDKRLSLLKYVEDHEQQNKIFSDMMLRCATEIDVMMKTFVDYNILVQYKEPNTFNHNLHDIN